MIKRIDISKVNYLLFVDTETIGSLYCQESVLPFEIGIKVYDNINKKIVKQKSYIIKKFFNNKYIMLSSFSATKYPQYEENIKNNKNYKLASAKETMQDISKIIKKYDIGIIVAQNGSFDQKALQRLANEFGIANAFEKLDLLDTMELSKIITYSKDYTKYCIDNKNILNDMKESAFITNSGRVRTTAQAIHSYLIQNPCYKEEHTALEDIDIEINIYEESLERLGNTIVKLNTTPDWRDYSQVLLED